MKIVFVLPDMAGGGTERVVAMLANEYIKRGYQVCILLFAGKKVTYSLDKHVEIISVSAASKGNPLIRIKRMINMRRFFKENRGCSIFAFSAMGAVFSIIATAGIPCRMLVSERNDPSKYEHYKIRDWAYGKADKIVLQTKDMVKFFPESYEKKMTVIPNPVPEGIPEPYAGERKKRIVSVARLQPQKNHKLLLGAFADFLSDFPEYELHIFGIGELEDELRDLAQKLHIENRVVFRGFSENVREMIIDSAMFVLSSDYEGISNSMIEALAMGIPVISTDCPVGGSRAYIKNGVNGMLVPVGDKSALTAAMKKIAGDEKFAKMLSRNAVEVKRKYALSEIADRFLKEAGI